MVFKVPMDRHTSSKAYANFARHLIIFDDPTIQDSRFGSQRQSLVDLSLRKRTLHLNRGLTLIAEVLRPVCL
jgi:hypothetical protein